MSLPSPRTVVSGVALRVVTTAAGDPDLIALGTSTWFAVDDRGQEYRVCGEGCLNGDVVRFHEKTDDGQGKDVRVWVIRQAPGGTGLIATP